MSSFWQKANEFRSSTFFITAVICYAIFIDQVFFAFILPVLPYSLPERNGIPRSKGGADGLYGAFQSDSLLGTLVQYWTAIEIVVFGVSCLAACRWWTDLHPSRRMPFLAGLVVLLASTLTMWLASPISCQVLGRVLQGIADAMIYIVGMAIIIDTVKVGHAAEYMGYIAIAMNLGTFGGPLLGGAVLQQGGYHAVWGMMLGFVVLDAVLRLLMAEKRAADPSNDIEASPTILDVELSPKGLEVANAPTSSPCSETDSVKEDKNTTRKAKIPDMIRLLASPRLLVALLGICVQAAIFSGIETVLSIYVQDIWHFTALGAGLMFIPLTIPAFFGPLIGRIVDRTSPRWAIVTGFLGLCPAIVLLRFVTHDTLSQKALLCLFLVIIGAGITMTLGPLTAEISLVAEAFASRTKRERKAQKRYGGGAYAQAYALFAMAWSVGNIGGPLLCGLIKDGAGWATMCWSLGLVSGLTAIPCMIWSGDGIRLTALRLCFSRSDGTKGEAQT